MSHIQHFEVKNDDGKITNLFVVGLDVGNLSSTVVAARMQSFKEQLEKMNLPNAQYIILPNYGDINTIVIPENVLVGGLDKTKAEEIIDILRKRFTLKQLKEI
jgi:phage replication-related protein YjqB (UPF0714/DUF867 family)